MADYTTNLILPYMRTDQPKKWQIFNVALDLIDGAVTTAVGPYGADNDYAKNRQKDHGPFPEHGPDEGLLMGARNVEPVNGGGDWTCTLPDHWIFEGTGMKQGDAIPGLIGWEYHGQPATEIPGLQVVGGGTAWQGGTRPQQ